MLTIHFPRQTNDPLPAQSTTSNFFGSLLLGIALILMVFDTATQSLFNIMLFGDTALGPSLLICFCVIVFFAAIAILERDIYILALFAFVIAFLLFYYLYFIFGTNRPLNFNTLGSYYGWLTFIVFYVLAKHGMSSCGDEASFFVYGAYLCHVSGARRAERYSSFSPRSFRKNLRSF